MFMFSTYHYFLDTHILAMFIWQILTTFAEYLVSYKMHKKMCL